MKINLAKQQAFFDQETHRIKTDFVLNPSSAQIWEYDQLLEPMAEFDLKKIQIFDMGSGSGRLTFELLRRGFNVTAYDISQNSLANLAQLYQDQKLPSWGKLRTTHQLPKAASADVIVGCDILHHLPLQEVLAEWKDLLKPTGMAIFSEPNALNLLWYGHLWLNKIPWEIEKGILQCYPSNLKLVFLAAGFSACQIYGHGLIPTPVPLPKMIAARNAKVWAKHQPNLAFRLQIVAKLN